MQNTIQSENQQLETVMNFLRQAVRTKHSENIDQNFLDIETKRIYDNFGNSILAHFKPMISAEQKIKLEQLVSTTKDQEEILAFLMESIENFEQKIIQYLVEFRDTYIAEKLNK